jgi:hypothetical protein
MNERRRFIAAALLFSVASLAATGIARAEDAKEAKTEQVTFNVKGMT